MAARKVATSGRSLRVAATITWSPSTHPLASAVSTASGPSSKNRVTPWDSRNFTPSAKRTASRTWRTQYSGVVTSSVRAPVTLETTRIDGVP